MTTTIADLALDCGMKVTQPDGSLLPLAVHLDRNGTQTPPEQPKQQVSPAVDAEWVATKRQAARILPWLLILLPASMVAADVRVAVFAVVCLVVVAGVVVHGAAKRGRG
jgi:hypothetical protein